MRTGTTMVLPHKMAPCMTDWAQSTMHLPEGAPSTCCMAIIDVDGSYGVKAIQHQVSMLCV